MSTNPQKSMNSINKSQNFQSLINYSLRSQYKLVLKFNPISYKPNLAINCFIQV